MKKIYRVHNVIIHKKTKSGMIWNVFPHFKSAHFIKMSPTITVASFFFFLFFVRPQNVCVVDTFYRTTKSTEPASGPPFEFFSALCDFFSNFLLSPNGPPFKFFDILQQTEVSKSPKGPPSLVFGTVRLFQNSHFSFFRKFFKKNSDFFNCLLQFF